MEYKISYPYKYVGLGGSFDHLHEGHHELLKTAFKMGEKVGIALTTNELHFGKEIEELIEPYNIRKEHLEDFIINKLGKKKEEFVIMPLKDPFGVAITDENLQAHVSSLETYKMALKINDLRVERGLAPLVLIVIPLVQNEVGKKISSSDIRKKIAKK
ncbi:Phosphopantetheine adenylyltransferase [Candidatus Lokiarchaeum ossiferum]|uniref:Phosphopantetheine adenylyltransferase n=1 Tax=Candidatus Lokiarchaeum ossiferum TaxID=2951803 RepID=A0ABY6HP32_9ARCH|nr:Phosphopantetheine adenylyltransferase [Candidatus Lokiarchaeum sp. B-35]